MEDASGRPPLRSRRGQVNAATSRATSGGSVGSGGATPPAPVTPTPHDRSVGAAQTRRSAADRHSLLRKLREREATVAAQTQELAELREALCGAREEARRAPQHSGAGRACTPGGARPVTSRGAAARGRHAPAGGCTLSVRNVRAKPERSASGPPDPSTRRQVAALRSQVLGIQAKLTQVLDTDSEAEAGAQSGGRP